MLTYAIILPVMNATNGALKMAGMPERFAPLVNLLGGLALGLIVELSPTGAVLGMMAGLGAGGAYDLVEKGKEIKRVYGGKVAE